MELGGKAPLVIMPSANLEMAASAAIFGGLLHSGQICMSTDLLLVHESISDKFAGILNEEFKKYSADPKSGFLRGLFAMKSADRLNGAIEDALQKGAKVVAGKHGREHNVIQPLVLGNIKDDMRLCSQLALRGLELIWACRSRFGRSLRSSHAPSQLQQ